MKACWKCFHVCFGTVCYTLLTKNLNAYITGISVLWVQISFCILSTDFLYVLSMCWFVDFWSWICACLLLVMVVHRHRKGCGEVQQRCTNKYNYTPQIRSIWGRYWIHAVRPSVGPSVDIFLLTLFLENHRLEFHETSQQWWIPSLVMHAVILFGNFSVMRLIALPHRHNCRFPPMGFSWNV